MPILHLPAARLQGSRLSLRERTRPLRPLSCVPAALIGLLLGGGGTWTTLQVVGYSAKDETLVGQSPRDNPAETKRPASTPGGTPSGLGGGGGTAGSGGGGGGANSGGASGPPARRTLSTTIGKLDFALGGVTLHLDHETRAKLAELLKDLEAPEEMTDDEAKAHLDAINSLLSEDEKSLLASFNVPVAGGDGGPIFVPGMGDPNYPRGAEAAQARPAAPSANGNPFKQPDNAKRLNTLREHLAAPAPRKNED